MYETSKIQEAEFFLTHMERAKERREFLFYLSAFLSSARSASQYGLKEAKGKTGGQTWYDSYVNQTQFLKFFKDKRDFNIHEEPVNVKSEHHIEATTTIHVSTGIRLEIRDKDGNLKSYYDSDEHAPKQEKEPAKDTSKSWTTFKFKDWPGPEDILQLAKNYVVELKAFVRDGQQNGFLSP